jgi:hypothetical protein
MVTALAGALQSLGADTSQQLVSRIYGKVTVILGFLPVLESMYVFFSNSCRFALKPSKTNNFVAENNIENQQTDSCSKGGNIRRLCFLEQSGQTRVICLGVG